MQDQHGYDPTNWCFYKIVHSIEKYKEYGQQDQSNRNLDYYKDSNVKHLREIIHMIYWIIACTHDLLDLHKYHTQYPEAMTLVENNPHLADKNNKDVFYTVEEQSKAVQQHFNPILAKRGSESGNFDMQKRFRNPQASIAQPKHPHNLPLLYGLST